MGERGRLLGVGLRDEAEIAWNDENASEKNGSALLNATQLARGGMLRAIARPCRMPDACASTLYRHP